MILGSSSVKKEMQLYYSVCVLVMALLLMYPACASEKHKEAAEQEVGVFHEQFNQQKYREIYANCSDELRGQASEEQFTALLRMIHDKLGDFRDSSQTDWRVGVTPTGPKVALNYKTEFTGGEAVEQFVFNIVKNKPVLSGYHVNSPLLVAE